MPRPVLTLLLAVFVAAICGCAAAPGQEPLTTSEYRRKANDRCAHQGEDLSALNPPPHLEALHDRATAQTDKGNRADALQLASIYRKLELSECVSLVTPDPADPEACRQMVSLIRDAHEERHSWAEEARAEQVMVEEIENEIRADPESRAAAETDLASSKRLVREAEREVEKAQREVERLEADTRDAGCGG